jgi:hypothetical protein
MSVSQISVVTASEDQMKKPPHRYAVHRAYMKYVVLSIP